MPSYADVVVHTSIKAMEGRGNRDSEVQKKKRIYGS
jgi:hypothetical protein